MTEPTRGQRRCMIYRHVRTVATACDSCGLSLTACQSYAEHESRRCCDECSHGGNG